MLNPFVLAFARPGYWNWTQDLGNWSPSAETSEGSSSAGSVGAPKPIAPEVVDPPNPQPAPTETKVDVQCQWFQALLAANPVLQRYKGILMSEGFDTKETMRFFSVEDMARLNIAMGPRRLLQDAIGKLKHDASSSLAV